MGYLKKTIGLRFLCIQDVIFGVDIIYKKGKIYKSEVEGCITNEEGNPCHEWIEGPDDEDWKAVFEVIGNKRRSGRGSISMHPRR